MSALTYCPTCQAWKKFTCLCNGTSEMPIFRIRCMTCREYGKTDCCQTCYKRPAPAPARAATLYGVEAKREAEYRGVRFCYTCETLPCQCGGRGGAAPVDDDDEQYNHGGRGGAAPAPVPAPVDEVYHCGLCDHDGHTDEHCRFICRKCGGRHNTANCRFRASDGTKCFATRRCKGVARNGNCTNCRKPMYKCTKCGQHGHHAGTHKECQFCGRVGRATEECDCDRAMRHC